MTTSAATIHRTTQYALDVTEGRVVACRLVKLAAQRHLRDLEDGKERGLRFDPKKADHAINFIERFCRLTGGRHEGKPFVLQPWQAFIVGCLFGWLGSDGFRRFRTAYVEIAKGSGKSPLAAAIGMYMLVMDGEARAEVYAAAAKRDQAMILFRDAVAMRDQSPALAKAVTPTGAKLREWNLAHLASGSFFRPVASEDNSQSGPRVHCALIDEIHEHRTASVVDMMNAGTKGRDQALILETTNAGTDESTVCRAHHDYSVQVLEGRPNNDAWFAFVCGLDACAKHREEGKSQPIDGCPDCDDWRDERVWPKANPNLGISITVRYLREQVEQAQGIPTKEGNVKRLNLCLWTTSETAWLPAELWAKGAGKFDRQGLLMRECCGALDVASKIDVAAFVLAFADYPAEGQTALLPHFWIPRATAESRQTEDGVPWLVWERDGFVTITDGDVIDLDAIEEFILEANSLYLIREVATDPWNAAQITTHLQAAGIKMVQFGQTLRNFNEPTKEFEARLKDGRIRHGSHPVLDWMAANVAVLSDRSGNVRPVKPKPDSPRKIDGIVAAVMGLGLLMVAPQQQEYTVEVW